ncbi:MAG: diacylglycerol kinase family lipid kinase [Lacinutrix sp.]|uniref:diacylglycerol/lipid kinase family protein n=1 Tax=Lacinutrix sp. TaxID=1937692 RepID=UPI0030B7915D
MELSSWFVIINPKAGNGNALKQWPKIKMLLNASQFNFKFAFTEYKNHAATLTTNAINEGFKNLICVGGDGTLHAIVNGLMLENTTESSLITIGIIPIGTGNDWVKTYSIPTKIEDAIQRIKKKNKKSQDIGKIDFLHSKKQPLYFNNLAGIGFDGLVAKKTQKLKHFGKVSYLIAACQALLTFKNFKVEVVLKNNHFTSKSLMILVGLCQYSGGGMRLTNNPNPKDGLFDVTNVKDFNTWNFITNLHKLYNGKVHTVKKVKTFKTDMLIIKRNLEKNKLYIQADGEVLEAENIKISILKKAFSFYC